MNETINKALRLSIKDNKIRYVYATYSKLVISFNPAPFGGHCYKCNPDNTVNEIQAVKPWEVYQT